MQHYKNYQSAFQTFSLGIATKKNNMTDGRSYYVILFVIIGYNIL